MDLKAAADDAHCRLPRGDKVRSKSIISDEEGAFPCRRKAILSMFKLDSLARSLLDILRFGKDEVNAPMPIVIAILIDIDMEKFMICNRCFVVPNITLNLCIAFQRRWCIIKVG